ncbi:MAG: hypothetical protein HQK83_11330 [Fibrobacteria bacterium]|nr:hypothetical protein [Fibrobacteria bacterium]
MKQITNELSKKKEQGMVLAIVMGLVVVIGLSSSLVYQIVQKDVQESSIIMQRTKADYAAEAALYWGLYLAKQPPEFTQVTHEPNGSKLAKKPITPDQDNCLYSKGQVYMDSLGWLAAVPYDTSTSFSGLQNEIIVIKTWKPSANEFRITGKASVNGITSSVQIFANI